MRLSRIVSFLLLVGVVPLASTSELRFSPERLEKVTAYIDQRVQQDKEAGLQLLIHHRGERVVLHNAGLLHGDNPISDDSIFFTHSMMKPITSLAVLQLLEEGKVLLSDPIANFLPEFSDMRVYLSGEGEEMVTRPANGPITVLQLLTHTAGYTYDFEQEYPAVTSWYWQRVDPDADLATNVTEMSKGPLAHDPGADWEYGPAANILGRLVEVVSGQKLSDYLKEHIFEPLKMVDSGYFVPPEDFERLAARFIRNDAGKLEESDFDRSVLTKKPVYERGDSGLFTTAEDYMRFCRMIMNGGELDGQRVASPKTIQLMTTNMVPWEIPKPIMPPGKGFTPGFSIYASHEETQSMVSEGSVNWGGSSGAIFWIDFQEELIVILLMQSYPPHAPRDRKSVV